MPKMTMYLECYVMEAAQWVWSLGGVNPTAGWSYALKWSLFNGHEDVFKWLVSLGVYDLDIEDNQLFFLLSL